MLYYGLPKDSFKHPGHDNSTVKGEWIRILPATNQPAEDQFFTSKEGTFHLLLNKSDFLAILTIDSEGMLTYQYELTEHSPDDWCSFHLLSEVGEPYQHLFAGINKDPCALDSEPWFADFLIPFPK